jgi:uncharacterized RDD family membrane protein YckC
MTAGGAALPRARRSGRRYLDGFVPPEGVPLRLEVAGLGLRFAALLIDVVLTFGTVTAGIALLALSDIDPGPAGPAFITLAFFVLRTPYYTIAELLWNGQTLGKRIARIRVISAGGRSLTPHQIVVRNLMREAEIFVPGTMIVLGRPEGWEAIILLLWMFGLVLVPLLSRRRQRLGDIVANTVVIHHPARALLPDLSVRMRTESARFVFPPAELDAYGTWELQVLERVLQARTAEGPRAAARRIATLAAIADRIRARTGHGEPVPPGEEARFLTEFYAAQRAHLERRLLFGEVRADRLWRIRQVLTAR